MSISQMWQRSNGRPRLGLQSAATWRPLHRWADMPATARRIARRDALPPWIEPQLTQLVKAAPTGAGWAHEIKYDGYRMHARMDRGDVQILTRTGLDWTANYPAVAAALRTLPVDQAYLDGELCGVRPDGTTSFSLMQNAHDRRGATTLVYFLFDLLHIDGENLMDQPLVDRKARLEALLEGEGGPLQYCGHVIGDGERFHTE